LTLALAKNELLVLAKTYLHLECNLAQGQEQVIVAIHFPQSEVLKVNITNRERRVTEVASIVYDLN
jgi:hypothetical protein